MSASSEENQTVFDPFEHLTSLCIGSRVTIDELADIDYPKGWAFLISCFIKEIQDIPVRIYRLDRESAQLELYFETKLQRHEVRVWRSLNEIRRLARFNCIECGAQIPQKKLMILELCPTCIKQGGRTGNTGTWLDKYIDPKDS